MERLEGQATRQAGARRRVALAALGAAAALGAVEAPAHAQACDPAEAEARATRIRTHLAREKRRARRWDLAWGAGLAVAAVGQGAMALTDTMPIGDYTDATEASLWVGAGKAAVGSAARFVLRLKIVEPGAPTPGNDACADAEAAERALRESGKNERTTFFLNHLGGLALNVGAALYLGLEEDAWSEAALGAALGYPVALAIAYTQPRDSWHAWRSGRLSASEPGGSVAVAPVRSRGFTGLIVGGAF